MTETVLIVQAIGTVCVAVVGLLTAIVTGYVAVRVAQLTVATKAVAQGVATVVQHTNSMKDALVKATGEAAFAAGEKSQREKPTA